MAMLSFLILYSISGLIVGSFLNVCIYRIPRGESIVFPGSHCPHCGKSIKPYDNIPVIAYLVLRGRCRFCKSGISFQYPAVELLSGMSFFACANTWGPTAPTYVNSLFLSAILVLVFVDFQHQILPNVITLPGAAAGVLLSPFQERAYYLDALSANVSQILWPGHSERILPWISSMVGAIIPAGILFLVGWTYLVLRKRQGLGMGDVKMMAFVGAFIGWRMALLTIFAGSCIGSIIGIFLILFRGKNLQTKLAFGMFLGMGAAIALFLGLEILDLYSAAR